MWDHPLLKKFTFHQFSASNFQVLHFILALQILSYVFFSRFFLKKFTFEIVKLKKTSTVFWCFHCQTPDKLPAEIFPSTFITIWSHYLFGELDFSSFREFFLEKKQRAFSFCWKSLIATNSKAFHFCKHLLCFMRYFHVLQACKCRSPNHIFVWRCFFTR